MKAKKRLSEATSLCARYVSASCTAHLNADKHVLRYLKGTSTIGITYGGEGCKLEAKFLLGFADADYAGELKEAFG